MNINERNENILMQNEEIEWFIREYNKLNNNYINIKKDFHNIENSLLNKLKNQEQIKEENKENNKEENNDKNESEKSFLENMFEIQ